jgi:hypothetical protein
MEKLSCYLNKHRIDIQTCMLALLSYIILMIGEFGRFTFVSDIYHIQLNNIFPNDGISADARFFPELLFQTIFYGTYLPSLFLLILASSLVIGGFIMIRRMNFLSGRMRILPILLLALHPFLFSHSAYIVNRLQTSCSIFFATFAAFAIAGVRCRTITRIVVSGILLSLSLISFQPAIGIFLVCSLFLHADAVFERNLSLNDTVKHLTSILAAIALSLIIYQACVISAIYLHVIAGVRVHSMMVLPATIADLHKHLAEIGNLLVAILFERTQFFPSFVKWLFILNLSGLAIIIYKRGQTSYQKIWHLLFLFICFFSFYFTTIFVYPIIPLTRIMPGLAFTWFFVFLFVMKFGGRISRSLALFSVIACVLIFSIQFNIMHERLAVKNEIDKQITWQIINRIQTLSTKNEELPVVALVGVLDHHRMPYWPKYSGVYKPHLIPDMLQSVYQFDWSKYRLIEFYYPCRAPNEVQWQKARTLVENMPLWPEEGSVVKGNGFIAVALSRPQ